ncbi:FKBP-type peptidyl-prolyl cis-trans isomerase FklB [Allofrancisella inopinata]|uniref:Peptidyl-prolyl cis-trans isomerase n=1 Tax=Allofrancisella inopinata TaxID=1085647 RepID=A0AAE6YIE9_9GAMM|nr:FKBP-type peptidyl-prolyl cis-trans isomerase N-terminal domain-containing protein [Allofrancisella inopinata]QIV96216.1 peptidylprolyl isomerase [Allofrancisella inopinata]TDT74486.1 FKBP-type peptidyl-prolyl cis-trans isomerase FklB [Allofrancisella inopinata]
MKLKKIVTIISYSLIGLTISSCSTTSSNDTSSVEQTDKTVPSVTVSTKDTTLPTAKVTVKQVKPITLEMPENASYTVGYQIGSGIAKQDFILNDEQTIAGFKDAMANKKPKLSEEQIQENIDSMKDKIIKRQLGVAKENQTNSSAFIEQISKMENIIKVNGDVYYQIVKQGNGKKPNSDSQVTIAYKGTTPVVAYRKDNSKLDSVKQAKLIGPTFDSSDNATFPLANLIQCWKDAIPEIPVGSTIILYCAPKAAYGSRAPAAIGPNQALSFEITLKDFK